MRTDKDNLQILYEDNHLLAVNKRCGDLVQGDRTGDIPLVELAREYIRRKYNKPGNVFCGLPHRIDRPTSGVVLLAKTSKALSRLSEMFRQGSVQKTYHAIVPRRDIPSQGTWRHYLVHDGVRNLSRAFDTPRSGAREAVTHYRVLSRGERYLLLELTIETGRHHQIRCQASHMGLPIKGDLKYGAPRSNPGGGICMPAGWRCGIRCAASNGRSRLLTRTTNPCGRFSLKENPRRKNSRTRDKRGASPYGKHSGRCETATLEKDSDRDSDRYHEKTATNDGTDQRIRYSQDRRRAFQLAYPGTVAGCVAVCGGAAEKTRVRPHPAHRS